MCLTQLKCDVGKIFFSSLLQSSVSHDLSEIILTWWFAAQEAFLIIIIIINAENGCCMLYIFVEALFFYLMNGMFKSIYLTQCLTLYKDILNWSKDNFDQFNVSLLNKSTLVWPQTSELYYKSHGTSNMMDRK